MCRRCTADGKMQGPGRPTGRLRHWTRPSRKAADGASPRVDCAHACPLRSAPLHQPRFPTQLARTGGDGPAIHLPHAGSVEDLSGQPQGARKHQSVILSGRQDRRARGERLRQVDAAAHHGRSRRRVFRRSLGGGGRLRRLPAAGAAARSKKNRARERHGGGRREESDPRPLQRDRDELFGRDRGRDDQTAGRDRGEGPVGPRLRKSTRRWTR